MVKRGRPRKIENVFNRPKSNVQFDEGQKSKGIVDDYAERQNVSTKEGTIEHVPTADNHIANKKYVDDEISGIPAAGDVSKVGTPVNNEIGVWTGDGTLEGDSDLTWDLTAFNVNGNITLTGSVDGIDVAGMSAFVTSNSTHRGDATGADHSDIVTAVGLNTAKDTNVTTNITVTEAPTNVSINSSDGSNDTIAAADVTNAGVMTTTMYDEHVVNTAKVTYVKTNVKGHIAHGATAGTSRPTGFTSVEWVGSVEPTNADNGDTWIDTT